MNILYIDRTTNLSEIRIGEQTIFLKYLPLFQSTVTFLLLKGKKRKSRNKYNASHKVYYRKNTFFLKRQISLDLLMILIKGIFICKKEKIDIIVARLYFTSGFSAWLLAKILKIKFVFFLSFPTWEAIDKKSKKYGLPWLFKIYGDLYKKGVLFLIRVSDLVVLKTKNYVDNIPQLINYKHKTISLPMGFDEDWLGESKVSNFSDCFNIPTNKRIVLYFGAVEPERKLEFLIQIIAQVKNTIPDIFLISIGGSKDDFYELKILSEKLGVEKNIYFLEQQPRNILFSILRKAELTISPIPPTPAYVISSPTKVIESLGFGVPVLANEEIIDQNEVITQSKGGFTVPYSVANFSDKLIFMLANPCLLKEMGKDAQQYILRTRNYCSLAKIFDDAIKEKNDESHRK